MIAWRSIYWYEVLSIWVDEGQLGLFTFWHRLLVNKASAFPELVPCPMAVARWVATWAGIAGIAPAIAAEMANDTTSSTDCSRFTDVASFQLWPVE